MECRDSMYHCLCAYMLDGERDKKALRVMPLDSELCPKCSKCNDGDRRRQIELQRHMSSLIQKRCSSIVAPGSLKFKVMSGLYGT